MGSPRSVAIATSWSAPVEAPGRRSTASQWVSRRSAVGYMICCAIGSPTLLPPAPCNTGRATHSPIIGRWPARKIGQAASSRQVRVIAGARTVGAGDQDEHGSGHPATVVCKNRQKQGEMCMLAAQRREVLLARLRGDGRLVAKELALELGISEDSIRRDLRDMAAAGLCQRVYGGALPASPAVGDYAARTTISVTSKESVATRAAGLIRPGSTVIVDGGTTALAVAKALAPDLNATVVTHSPIVASALVAHALVEVVIIGGRLFKHSAVSCGAAAAEAAERVHADLFLMGVTGVHPDAGLTTGDADEAAMKRILASRAADTYVLASAEKIGAASRFAVLPLDEIAGIITDSPGTNPTVRRLSERGIPVLGPGGENS